MANKIPAKERLKRFLYTSSEEPRYITGNPEKHGYYSPDKVKSIVELLESNNPEILLNIIEVVNSENLLPRRETIFIVLAYAATSNITVKDAFKHKLYTTLLNVCKTCEELFLFVKYYSMQKKNFSSALNKTVAAYYMKQDPMELAKRVSETTGFHGWKHKDLIKLSHCKTDSILIGLVMAYVLFDLKKAKEFAEGNPAATDIVTYLSKVEELKRCEKEDRISKLITEIRASYTQVPSYFLKTRSIWEALIPSMPIPQIITYLPKLHKYGFFRGNCPVQSKVVEALNNPDKIKESKIYPSEVFIGIKNFEKGGKPIDPKLQQHLESKGCADKIVNPAPPQCAPIFSALNKALQLSYANLQPTGKRIMITIDMSSKMDNSCLKTKNVTCLEAAVTMILSIVRVEREVCVAVFANNKIIPVTIDQNTNFHQALTKLRQVKTEYVLPSAVFDWASKKKKQVDVFINFLYYHHWFLLIPKEIRDKEKPRESLKKYRKTMNLPRAKLITFSLSSPHLALADGSLNIIDICGFDKEVPKVVETFCKDSFC